MAPAGPLSGAAELAAAVENARSMGWEPVPGAHVLARMGYLAGEDADRLRDLHSALTDPSVDGVWCVRGGYGVLRLIDRVDYEALRRAPKALIGFSDITALHAAVVGCAGIVSFHGPTARQPLSPFTRDSLRRAVCEGRDSAGAVIGAEVLRPGVARGRLAGGNLALLVALAGTPYFPDLRGAILVLEDVNEPVYRIDRMLQHLRLAGALEPLAGLVFGAFTERGGEPEGEALPLARVLREAAEAAGVPCFAGAPVGHLDDQWTLPLGALAELDASAGRLTILPQA